MLKRSTFFYLFAMVLFLACSKTELKSYEYWNEMVNAKYREISILIESVPCSNINEFEIVRKGDGYYLVHSSVRQNFDKLQVELEQLEKERNVVASRTGILNSPPLMLPNPPIRKICEDGKPKLVYPQSLSLEEINTELLGRYEEIQAFYKDVPCTDAGQWTGLYIRSGCNLEGVAVHKTIGNEEMVTKINIYNRLVERKIYLEKSNCDGAFSLNQVLGTKPVQCKEGKPIVILE